MRNNKSSSVIKNSAELKISHQEHQIYDSSMDYDDMVRIPQKQIVRDEFISKSKRQFDLPPKELLPDSKSREAYMQLVSSQSKPFNKKVGEIPEFHEALNIKGLHEKRYGKGTYENAMSSSKRQSRLNSQSKVSLGQSRYENLRESTKHGHSMTSPLITEADQKSKQTTVRNSKDQHQADVDKRNSIDKILAEDKRTQEGLISSLNGQSQEQSGIKI